MLAPALLVRNSGLFPSAVLDIRFPLAGYPDVSYYKVPVPDPAKMINGTGTATGYFTYIHDIKPAVGLSV